MNASLRPGAFLHRRPLRSLTAAALSFVLLALSPGAGSYQALAAEFEHNASAARGSARVVFGGPAVRVVTFGASGLRLTPAASVRALRQGSNPGPLSPAAQPLSSRPELSAPAQGALSSIAQGPAVVEGLKSGVQELARAKGEQQRGVLSRIFGEKKSPGSFGSSVPAGVYADGASAGAARLSPPARHGENPGASGGAAQGGSVPQVAGLQAGEKPGQDGVSGPRAALRPEASSLGGMNVRAIAGNYLSRFLSVIGLALTSIVYAYVVKPVVGGDAGFANIMALGTIVSIVAGPVSGWMVDNWTARNSMIFNNVVQILAILALPLFQVLGCFNAFTATLGAMANAWSMGAIMTTDRAYLTPFAGEKNVKAVFSGAHWIYLLVGFVVTVLPCVVNYIRGHDPMMAFYIAAALRVLAIPVIWLTIPNVTFAKSKTLTTLEASLERNARLGRSDPEARAKLEGLNASLREEAAKREAELPGLIAANEGEIRDNARSLEMARATKMTWGKVPRAAAHLMLALGMAAGTLPAFNAGALREGGREIAQAWSELRAPQRMVVLEAEGVFLAARGASLRHEAGRRSASWREAWAGNARLAGAFLKRYWWQAGLFAVAAASFPFLHSAFWLTAALMVWIATTPAFKTLVAQPGLLTLTLLLGLGAFMFNSGFQGFALQGIAEHLAGAGKVALLAKLQAVLFLGQMASVASLMKFPLAKTLAWGGLKLELKIEHFVQLGVAALFASWVCASLLPAGLPLAASFLAVFAGTLIVINLSSRLTNRAWIQFSILGFAPLAVSCWLWPAVAPLLLATMALSFVFGAGYVAMTALFQSNSDKRIMGVLTGIQGAMYTASMANGYSTWGWVAERNAPAVYPQTLWWLAGGFIVLGALNFLLTRRLKGLEKGFMQPGSALRGLKRRALAALAAVWGIARGSKGAPASGDLH